MENLGLSRFEIALLNKIVKGFAISGEEQLNV